jgi:hypothetical protein
MSQAQGTPPSSADKLRFYLDLAYPIVLHIPAGSGWFPLNSEKEDLSSNLPPDTEIGHSVVCIGYHLNDPATPALNFFEFHDPWHGPNVWVSEATLFGADSGQTVPENQGTYGINNPSAWYQQGGPYTWGAPWLVSGLTSGTLTADFVANPIVVYTDLIFAALLPGATPVFPVVPAPQAELSVSGGMSITSGANPQSLNLITTSATLDTPSWNVQLDANGDFLIRCDAWGDLAPPLPTSTSYPGGYADTIWGYDMQKVTIAGTRVEDWMYY